MSLDYTPGRWTVTSHNSRALRSEADPSNNYQLTRGTSIGFFDSKTAINSLRGTVGGRSNGVTAATIGLQGYAQETSSAGAVDLDRAQRMAGLGGQGNRLRFRRNGQGANGRLKPV